MVQNRLIPNTERRFKEFKEFNYKDKERIASIVESNHKEFILAPTVESYIYFSSRALDYGDIYGANGGGSNFEHAINKNSDYFDQSIIEEMHPTRKIARFETFRGCGVYTDHNSKSIENSIGFLFDVYNVKNNLNDLHITLLGGVDKTKAPRIAKSLEDYPDKVPTSMGCSITDSICTVCGKSSCDHLKFMRGGRVGGTKVAEMLLGVEFFEDSIVSVPACSTAYVLDAVSKIIPGRLLKVASATDSNIITAQIMTSIYESIKTAKTLQEKSRLSDSLDRLILKLESGVN
jgi:hypothetical protein